MGDTAWMSSLYLLRRHIPSPSSSTCVLPPHSPSKEQLTSPSSSFLESSSSSTSSLPPSYDSAIVVVLVVGCAGCCFCCCWCCWELKSGWHENVGYKNRWGGHCLRLTVSRAWTPEEVGKMKFTIDGFTSLPVSSSSPSPTFDLNERDTDRISQTYLLHHHTLTPSFIHHVRQ